MCWSRGSARQSFALNPHTAWALLQILNVVSRHAMLEDSVVVTPPDYHRVRVCTGKLSCFVYALVDGSHVMLGEARSQLQQASSA